MFKTLDDMKNLTVKEVLTKIAEDTHIEKGDELIIGYYAKKMFPNACVTYGLVYLNPSKEPPVGVNQFAGTLLKALQKKASIKA